MSVNLKPISLLSVILIFLVTLIPILLGVYLVIPWLLSMGIQFFIGYLIGFQTLPFVFVFILALVLYKKEGNIMNWQTFKERMRLRFNNKIFLASIGLLVFGLTFYLILQSVTRQLSTVPLMAPPSWFGPGIHPLKTSQPGEFFGMALLNAWWAPIIYLIGWFFNIAGEELLFRGYLLPRMELSFGSKACLINSSCWWIWHIFWRWQLVALFPIVFLLPFVAQKTKSTIPGIIAHGTMNFISIILIIFIVVGIK